MDDFSTVEGGSETGIHRLPDFKSMLEAALRGDVVRAYQRCVYVPGYNALFMPCFTSTTIGRASYLVLFQCLITAAQQRMFEMVWGVSAGR